MNMEAGEIRDSPVPADYDPSLEWPGDIPDDEEGETTDVCSSTRPLLRLLVLRTSVLPPKQTLVMTDGSTDQLQFGRDVLPSQDIPRVRLKEMEVSELHATAYWDNAAGAWNILDMGSKHGTYLQPMTSTTAVRLSPPRVASVPRRLHHLDTLAIGSTTFLVHIHAEGSPCNECASTFQNEIPLFAKRKTRVANLDAGYLPATSRDPKKALTMLKQRLLTSSTSGPVRGEATSYKDRSAQRRSLYPASRLDAPGIAPAVRIESSASTWQQSSPALRPTVAESWNPPIQVTASQPPVPLPTTNVGHRLLLAQGWTPGSSLGQDWDGHVGLTAPLEVASTTGRAGLGMTKGTTTPTGRDDWRVDGKQRRWQDMDRAKT